MVRFIEAKVKAKLHSEDRDESRQLDQGTDRSSSWVFSTFTHCRWLSMLNLCTQLWSFLRNGEAFPGTKGQGVVVPNEGVSELRWWLEGRCMHQNATIMRCNWGLWLTCRFGKVLAGGPFYGIPRGRSTMTPEFFEKDVCKVYLDMVRHQVFCVFQFIVPFLPAYYISVWIWAEFRGRAFDRWLILKNSNFINTLTHWWIHSLMDYWEMVDILGGRT
jgi:hypothetical protein